MLSKKKLLKGLVKNYKASLVNLSTFELQKEMIDKNYCPNCGEFSRGGMVGTFSCYECGFRLTEWQLDQVLGNDAKWILLKKLRGVTKK